MKTSTICLLAASAAAAAAPVAHAGPRVDYQQVFTTPVPGQSAGVDTRLLYKNPNDPKAKPIPVRREIFTFPEGTIFDGAGVPDCTAPDLELQLMGDAACPPEVPDVRPHPPPALRRRVRRPRPRRRGVPHAARRDRLDGRPFSAEDVIYHRRFLGGCCCRGRYHGDG